LLRSSSYRLKIYYSTSANRYLCSPIWNPISFETCWNY